MSLVTASAASTNRRVPSSRLAAALTALAAAVGVVALWWVFVATPSGQRIEQITLEGSAIGRWRLAKGARTVLDVVSVSFLAIVILIGVVVALARRQWLLAGAVPLMVGGANVTTQLLKYQVFPRPSLGFPDNPVNSLPSGHTTVAGTVAAVAVLIAPPRWRWAAALAGWGYAGGTGLATIVNGWHRASDVAAALLVVLMWAALTLAVVGSPADADAGHRANRATLVLLLLASAGSGVLAAVALAFTWSSTAPVPDRMALLVAYGGACAGIAAITCLVAGVMLSLCIVPSPGVPRDRIPRHS